MRSGTASSGTMHLCPIRSSLLRKGTPSTAATKPRSSAAPFLMAACGSLQKTPELLYALVEEQGLGNTKVVLTGVTPGGEAKVANQARSKNRNRQAEWYDPRDHYYPLGPRGAAFLGVAGLAVPIPTGLRATIGAPPGYLSSARILALRRVMQI